ncbi:MAG TPA: type VI secretion system baseplate subunit TssF [Bryobacteraceae bacterium]|nr:type VI secretion system baseplate subunit TssF [Bryobacteraceae bacterium]
MKGDGEDLRYYEEELASLRTAARDFAAAHRSVAGELVLQDGYPADPHVERLIESFAFLTGRLRRDLEKEFPEISTSVLGLLYPHMTEPIPPLSVARFDIDPKRHNYTTAHEIPKHTPLFAYEKGGGATCRFRTCYPVNLYPVEVTKVAIEPRLHWDFLRDPRIEGVLRVRVSALGKGTLKSLEMHTLRLYLDPRAGPAWLLYDLLWANLLDAWLVPENGKERLLKQPALTPVGFGRDDDILPAAPQSHPAYRLIQEYFYFPEKFLFFDVGDLEDHGEGRHFDLLFTLNRMPRENFQLSPHTIAHGCTPIANLFPRTTEPVRLDHRRLYYRLVPDSRRERTTEIHSITKVTGSTNPTDESLRYEPFYSYRHSAATANAGAFWYARRERTAREDLPGMDLYLSFLDLNFSAATPPAAAVFAHTLCTNRWLATEVDPGARLQMEEVGPVTVSCVARPTPPVYPPLGGPAVWRLVSNLTLNHLSLEPGDDGLACLREILRVHCFDDRPGLLQQINGISKLDTKPAMARHGFEAWRGFRPGLRVTLTFDESLYAGGSALLFAAVLRHFLALYASVNSWTQLVAVFEGREIGKRKEWDPLTGYEALL